MPPGSLAVDRRCALLLMLSCLPLATGADTLADDNIKAGFVLNFAKYAEWPPAALADAQLRVCSLGPQALSGQLAQLQGRQVHGREIRVRDSARADEWRECHVLYITADEQHRVETVLRAIGQAPVLTISDSSDFARAGGMIGLKTRAGRIRFDINRAATRRAGLNLSSQLLKLADEVTP